MKRFAICTMCALLLLTCLAACGAPAAEPTASPSASPEASAQPAAEYDWDAIYSSYEPETVVMTINGEDVLWNEFFYWIYNNYAQYFAGYDFDLALSDGMTLGQYLAVNAMTYCVQYHVLDQEAEANGVQLTDYDLQVLDEQVQSDIESLVGEDGTEEELYERLAELYVTPELYDFVNRMMVMYPRVFMTLYGENAEKVTDEETLAFAAEYGYMTAKHILFRTVDDSGNELTDDEKSDKRAQAQQVLDELLSVPESDREAHFDELMNRYSEDPGLERYPNGYCFEPGVVVDEFAEGVAALEPGEISGIVESSSGYHILLREPVTPDDSVLMNTSEVYTLRYTAAVYEFNDLFTSWISDADVEYTEEFENFDLSALAQ